MNDTPTWQTLLSLLSDDSETQEAVVRGIGDLDAYFSEYEDDLFERGIEEVDDLEDVIVLVDTLMRSGELAYFDWKSGGEDIASGLAEVPRLRTAGIDLAEISEVEGLSDAVMAAVNQLLAPAGLTAVMIDEGSDAVPIVVVSAGDVPTIQKLAEQLELDVVPL